MDYVEDLLESISAWVQAAAGVVRDAGEAMFSFFGANPGPAFTFLGALIALLSARFVHFDRIRREHNARVRSLLGEYVGAVNALHDAKAITETRRSEYRKGAGFMAFVPELIGKPADPSVLALRSRLGDAVDAQRAAQSNVDALFFQISITNDKSKDDLVFCAKALEAFRSQDDYFVAYNFALAVAARHFGDDRRARSRARSRLNSARPELNSVWERHVARAEEAEASSAEVPEPSGTGQ